MLGCPKHLPPQDIRPAVTFAERMTDHVNQLNQAWQDRQFDALAQFYHPNVVLLPPDAGPPIVGRDGVVASYQDFAAAELVDFTAEAIDTFEFGDTGVCHLRFQIEYLLEGSRYRERGVEVYVMTRVGGELAIIWRSQSLTEVSDFPANE